MSTARPGPKLTLHGLSKRFGSTVVLENFSLELNPGQCTLLLGRNGSGKSTLLRVIAGLVKHDAGEVRLDGSNPLPPGSIGFLGHQHSLYGALSVAENLHFFASLRGIEAAVEHSIDAWRLSEFRHKPLDLLSKGLQARAALAASFLHNPQHILLDEPTSALDSESSQLLKQQLTKAVIDTGATVLIATHDLSAFEGFAARAVVLDKGLIAADSVQQGLQAAIDHYRRGNR